MNTAGAFGPGAALVIQRVPTLVVAGGFGSYRDGGIPESGLNFAGEAGGEFVVMNWCGGRAFVSDGEFVCAGATTTLASIAATDERRIRTTSVGLSCKV